MKPKPRKEQILSVSARLFRQKGYKATSVRIIASELGMEAASLYNHIASKQEILKELLLEMAGLFTTGMNSIEISDADSFQKLENLVALHVHLTFEFPNEIALITGEWVHLEEPAYGQYITLRNEYEQKFKSIIRQGMEDGHLENTDIDIALFSILSTLRWLYSWVSRHKEISPEMLEKEMKRTLLEGVKKR